MTTTTKLSYSERGKLGAKALNSDIAKKKESARKATATKLKNNPNFFKEIGAKKNRKGD